MQREITIEMSTGCGSEEIALLQHSDGATPIIAWHGITAVNRFWLWDALWSQGQVMLAGLPGHGPVLRRAPEHYSQWTAQHFIDVGVAVTRMVARSRPVTLIGHSTGGMIALGVALQAPELVGRLILISPVVWNDLRGIVGIWARFRQQWGLLRALIGMTLLPGQFSYLIFRESLRAFIADPTGFYGNAKTHRLLRDGYEHYCQTSLDAVAGTVRVISGADLRPTVERCRPTTPTLLLHGDRDNIVPFQQSEWLAQALPNVQLATIPGAGHLCFGEQEERCNQEVVAWLAQHPVAHDTLHTGA